MGIESSKQSPPPVPKDAEAILAAESSERLPESPESPDAQLARELVEVIQADDSESLLVRKILERKLTPEAYNPLMRLLERLEDVFDLGERARIVDELAQKGVLPQDIQRGILTAFLKDERRTTDLLSRFASKEYKKAGALHGEEIPYVALAEAKERLLLGFVAEAEKIKRAYISQGKGVPEKEVQGLRSAFNSLAKPFRNYIRSELGSIALSQVDPKEPQRELSQSLLLEDIFGTLNMLDGEEQERLARDAYGLYEMMAGYYQERDIAIFSRRTPSGRPPFHISGMQELLARAWEYEIEHPGLTRRDKRFSQYLAGLEEFLLKKGHHEIKEAIRKRKRETEEGARLREQRRTIFDVNREVAEQMLDGQNVFDELKGYGEKVRGDLKADVVRLGSSADPVRDHLLVARILQAIPAMEAIQKEVEDLETGGKKSLLERIYIPPGMEHRYTADAFTKLVSERRAAFEHEIEEAADQARKGELLRTIVVAQVIEETEDRVDYALRLKLAFTDGVIGAEEYQGFLNFIEVNAMIAEAKARIYEAEADFLKRQDASRMSERDRTDREDRISDYSFKAAKMGEYAALIRQGAKAAQPMLKK